MWNLKIQVSKLNPPTEQRLHVGALIPKDKNPTADKHKNQIKEIYLAW